MKAKEIHDLLLSLLVRGLGFWLLYLSVDNVWALANQLDAIFFPSVSSLTPHVLDDFLWLILHLLVAAYFIVGAPPLLTWATRNRDSR